MADKADILLQFWLEQGNQARQAEAQRATTTNIILLVVAEALGFAATRGNHQRSTLLVFLVNGWSCVIGTLRVLAVLRTVRGQGRGHVSR
ncbi:MULTISPECIES: hypothetical protein [Streptomyces]|uniref:DUF565 domain-containing protein n=1 Tax=Streptomyces canarius TaxID=285453 RepID=A0ABQ3DCX2_9ACTN|nr:hypothetical protein [Streptomyces canarius]GHA78045.1 hypothetical protein GCM10010345_94370 [Streptomyces canarius]